MLIVIICIEWPPAQLDGGTGIFEDGGEDLLKKCSRNGLGGIQAL